MSTLLFAVFALFGIYAVIDPLAAPVMFVLALTVGLGLCALSACAALYTWLRPWLDSEE